MDIRKLNYVIVIILGFHSLGLAVSVGMALWFDLHLLGMAMRQRL